jgi:hypothetical protein
MFERLPSLFRSALYALRGGFLIRPLAIALVLPEVLKPGCDHENLQETSFLGGILEDVLAHV